jgi:hypothetical protein
VNVSTRYFALACGVTFLLAGIGGFLPFVTPPATPDAPPLVVTQAYGYLLGLFPINLVHNLIHLAIGVAGLVAWRSDAAALAFARGLAIFLGVLTLMGVVPALRTTFGLAPLYGHDIWLHGVEAAAAAYFGFVAAPRATRSASPVDSAHSS